MRRTVVLTALLLTGCASTAEPPGLTLDPMLVLHDGDHRASTYADGVLAPAQAGHRDLLSTVSVTDGAVRTAEVEVSNSVTAAPEVIALSPDGATAFVTERLAQRGPADTTAAQLAPGDGLFAIDVSDRSAPQVRTEVTIAESPEALAVSPDGGTVAVVSNTPAVLTLVPWQGAAGFGAPREFPLFGPDANITNIQWHPDGDLLAVNINNQNRVAFVGVGPEGAHVRGVVDTGPDPFAGRFTPDGAHYLTSNWGRDLTAPDLAGRLPSAPSTLSVIDVATGRVVTTVDSDRSAEGLAISADGRWVATVNMRGTAIPEGEPGHDDEASVSLFRFDTGALTKIGDYPLTGVLPEGGAFDPSGRYFVATVFEASPGLRVYELGPDDEPGLTEVQRIDLPHGVHHVVFG